MPRKNRVVKGCNRRPMADGHAVTIRSFTISPVLLARLEKFASLSNKSASLVMSEAVENHLKKGSTDVRD